ncbi:hypothetical protein ACSSMG_15860, partial [Escherichia coli]
MRRTFTAEEKASVFELWKNGTGFSEIANILGSKPGTIFTMNRPGFPGECFICELRLPDHR